MSLTKIAEISNKYGANPEFVLAGGGNTSYKDAKFLYIKGSGTTLANITESGFVKMNRKKLSAMFSKQYSENAAQREAQVLEDMMDAREKTELSKRPSVETLLHNLIHYKYIVHTHPSMLNGMTCGANGKKMAKELFGDNVIWIDIIEPGYVLAAKLKEEMDKYKAKTGKDADIILLQNHGVFIAANSEREINKKTKYVFGQIESKIKRKPDFKPVEYDKEKAALIAPAIRMLLKSGDSSIVTFRTNKEVMNFVQDEKSFYPVSSAYSPDHIVYCKPYPLFVKSSDDMETQYEMIKAGIETYQKKNGYAPKIIAIQNLGFYAWGTNKKNADICAEVFLDACKIGVYSEAFGGPLFMTQYMIDFICNWEVESYRSKVSLAGGSALRLNEKIAIAGALEEMTVPKFELVTKINYTAYYICAKFASRIMKIQHQFAPDYKMDIIQINSKSGLEGSNKNFAYAGSKFGGVGLTQSFALELVPYNIKVNAICSGNLLNGPLWSDPEKGLFVQYFKAGKVPGAKSVADVRAFYENKVPMRRGCEIIDVARAIFYIVEQEYETGQAIPVTGGQIMLN